MHRAMVRAGGAASAVGAVPAGDGVCDSRTRPHTTGDGACRRCGSCGGLFLGARRGPRHSDETPYNGRWCVPAVRLLRRVVSGCTEGSAALGRDPMQRAMVLAGGPSSAVGCFWVHGGVCGSRTRPHATGDGACRWCGTSGGLAGCPWVAARVASVPARAARSAALGRHPMQRAMVRAGVRLPEWRRSLGARRGPRPSDDTPCNGRWCMPGVRLPGWRRSLGARRGPRPSDDTPCNGRWCMPGVRLPGWRRSAGRAAGSAALGRHPMQRAMVHAGGAAARVASVSGCAAGSAALGRHPMQRAMVRAGSAAAGVPARSRQLGSRALRKPRQTPMWARSTVAPPLPSASTPAFAARAGQSFQMQPPPRS